MSTADARAAFDALMADLGSPMAVVTTAADGVTAGCLVGFHSQCGMEPARYAVWLSKANRTYRVGVLSEHFAVHLLDRDQHDLAELFGTTTGDEVDKFARCDWRPGPAGVPLLDACPNRVVGRRRALLDVGADHVGLVLEPIAVERATAVDPLPLADVVDLEPGHGAEERQRPR